MDSINNIIGDAVSVLDGKVSVKNEAALKSETTDKLVAAAVFGDKEEKEHARWLLWELGQAVGVRPSSIHDLYMARGRGEIGGFTVPAINVRGASYLTARSIFRTANRMKAGAFILEIARSEIGYTDQRPAEYVSGMIAAGIREGFRGSLLILGVNISGYAKKCKAYAISEWDA